MPQHYASIAAAVSAPRRDGDRYWKEAMDEKKGDVVEQVENLGEKV